MIRDIRLSLLLLLKRREEKKWRYVYMMFDLSIRIDSIFFSSSSGSGWCTLRCRDATWSSSYSSSPIKWASERVSVVDIGQTRIDKQEVPTSSSSFSFFLLAFIHRRERQLIRSNQFIRSSSSLTRPDLFRHSRKDQVCTSPTNSLTSCHCFKL